MTVTSSVDVVVDVLQLMVGGSLAKPWHSVSVVEELVTLPVRLFVTW
jgi:hypothetical protein